MNGLAIGRRNQVAADRLGPGRVLSPEAELQRAGGLAALQGAGAPRGPADVSPFLLSGTAVCSFDVIAANARYC